jgi:hypothetical protein
MPQNGPINSPFGNPLVSTPDASSATMRGGDWTLNDNAGAGGKGLTGTPFESPMVSAPGQSETPNSGGIPPLWDTVGGIPDAPAPGSTAAVADGVATPNTPVGNMTGGKDGKNIGIGQS